MKKILAMLMALTLMLAFTACGNEAGIQVKSLTPKSAYQSYVSTAYTNVGYSMKLTTEYDGKTENIEYSVLFPGDEAKIQYNYKSDSVRAAFANETLEGASINLLFLDNGTEKTAPESTSKDAEVKKYAISPAVISTGFDEDKVTMELGAENSGSMTFTCMGAHDDLLNLVPGVEKNSEVKDELKNITYKYVVENSELKSVEISGVIAGKEFKASADSFALITDRKTSMEFEDSDSFEKKITSDLEALAKQQEEEEQKAEEAATSEGAAGSAADAGTDASADASAE